MIPNICLCCEQQFDEVSHHTYHNKCLRNLWGTARLPKLHFATDGIFTQAQKMIGQMSISGVQEKLSVRLTDNKETILVVAAGGTHILKPSPSRFPHLAENENFFMNLAKRLSIETPPHGLFPLSDGQLTYVIKRFDRDEDGGKIPVEDFAQLLGKRDKYAGSIEEIGDFLKKHSTIPFLDTQKLFVRTLFNFLIGNGDAHLKNFSMFFHPLLGQRLAPAYDIVSSRLVLTSETDDMALNINRKKSQLITKDFVKLAEYLEIEKKSLEAIMSSFESLPDTFNERLAFCLLPQEMKNRAEKIFAKRYKRIFGQLSVTGNS